MPLAQDRERLEQPRVVLVRPAAGGDRRGSARARLSPGRNTAWSIPRWIGAHAALGDAQALDDGSGRVLRDRDHERAPAYRRAVFGTPVERARLARRTAGGTRAAGRARSWPPGARAARDHHGEREVHGVEAGQPRAEASRRGRRPPPSRASGPASSATRDIRPPSRSGGRRRPARCGAGARVLVSPHGPESADELAGVRLAAARDPWHEREEADADPHVR